MNCRHCNVPAAPCELVEHAAGKGCCIGCLLKRHEKLTAGVRELLEMSAESIAQMDRASEELAEYPATEDSRIRCTSMRCVHQIYHAVIKELLP